MRLLLICLLIATLLPPNCLGQEREVIGQAKADVAKLASPEFAGRGYEGEGHLLAANYIADRFEEIGLIPIDTTFFHPFNLEADGIPSTPEVSINGQPLRPGFDFLPFTGGPSDSVQQISVVSVGHGLLLPAYGVDAYGGRDIKGRIVVIDADPPSSLRADTTLHPAYLTDDVKIEMAAYAGARAAFIPTDRLLFSPRPRNPSIPAFYIRREAWPGTVDAASYTITSLPDQKHRTSNVIGIIKGTAEPDSAFMITAHYDHLGRLGEEVYFPGANDNASGIAMLLGLAHHFKQYPPRHSILFTAFSGEEMGLLGAKHFVQSPPFPLENIKFLLNLDMIASGEKGLVAVGGIDFPSAFAHLESANMPDPIPLRARPNAFNSDHFVFLQMGIPGLYVYTDGGTQPYHHVEDLPESLEWDDFEEAFALLSRFLTNLDGLYEGR